MTGRKTVETKSNDRQKDGGNKEQRQAERRWKQRTMTGRKTVETKSKDGKKTMETKNNGRQKDDGYKEQWTAERRWKYRTMHDRKAKLEVDRNGEPIELNSRDFKAEGTPISLGPGPRFAQSKNLSV